MTVPFCRNDCVVPANFPAVIFNRPGLSHIGYRIGTYAAIRAALMHDLDTTPSLFGWSHREPDDPGIALLEGAAIVGDVLTFYQELYANEAYLRTARWRESITELVRLLGYRLAPGLGGKGTFALEVTGTLPVSVPAGFPVKAQVASDAKSQDFQLTDAFTAYPHLSRFRLYRPRNAPQPITSGHGENQLEVDSVAGANDTDAIASLDLQKGDRVMLAPVSGCLDPRVLHLIDNTDPVEIVVVQKVEQVLDRRIITFDGPLTHARGATVNAYKLGRTFHHFGGSAPGLTTTVADNNVSQVPTRTTRNVDQEDHSTDTDHYSKIAETDMPLDRQVDNLSAGRPLICELDLAWDDDVHEQNSGSLHTGVVRTIQRVRSDTLLWGNLTSATTVIMVDEPIADTSAFDYFVYTDVRTGCFHETRGPPFVLRAPSTWASGAVTDRHVAAFATQTDVLALAGRALMLVGDDGTTQSVYVSNTADDFPLADRDAVHPWVWPVLLDRLPDAFTLDDFDEAAPTVTVFGNVAEGTQGKSEPQAIAGSGDGRQTFQTFKIPKAPLTYFEVAGNTPPETPELLVYVEDILWTRVPSLFAHGPNEMIYIVREDSDGSSWIQFGDGQTGARLPSGLNNVVVQWRTGVNAFGALAAGTTPQAGARLERLDKIRLPGVIAGGAAPETGGHARETAPGRIQSLDRLVSLWDYETETMAIAGVARAEAAWQIQDGVPMVVLTVLMQSGRESEIDAVRDIITTANRCRGPRRFPVMAVEGHLRWSYLAANVTIEANRKTELVVAAITAALLGGPDDSLGDPQPGLFTPASRRFGDPEYATRIEGIIQEVAGVVWTEVTGFGMLDPGDDPGTLAVPAQPWSRAESVTPEAGEILTLDSAHLVLSPVAAAVTGGCT
ncbi:MAG TPA: hypothetical protein VGJ18_10170 [Gemmatimonadaceae bacterium]